MGGHAFTSYNPPVKVPRLPPPLYHSIRDQYLSLLSAIYLRVASPTAAPEKASHGDIDILVAIPTRHAISAYLDHQGFTRCCPYLPDHVHAAKHLLNAQHLIHTAANPITTFAVPHSGSPDASVQVDITLCPDATFDWQRCLNSHGDFWLIVSHACSPFGLSFTDSGLHIRDDAIEKHEWSKKFFVTADPDAVLDFLDLDVKTYWQNEGFGSTDAMFEYLSNMRFFRPGAFLTPKDRPLNSTERKRLANRADYRKFCEEYVPKLSELSAPAVETREEIQDEVVAMFNRKREWHEWKAAWWHKYWQTRTKQVLNLVRKEKAQEKVDYADAWIKFLAQTFS